MIVAFLEIIAPLISAFCIIYRHRDTPGGQHALSISPILQVVSSISFVAALYLQILSENYSIYRFVEYQLIWIAPLAFWSCIAVCLSLSRPGVKRRMIKLSILIGVATGISWLFSTDFARMILLAPRYVGDHPVQVWWFAEAALPSLTTFAGRTEAWAVNRLILVVVAGLLYWRLNRRAEIKCLMVPETIGLTAGILFCLVIFIGPDSVTCRTWRASSCDGKISVPIDVRYPEIGQTEVSFTVIPSKHKTTNGVLVAAVGGPSAASQSRRTFVEALGDLSQDRDILLSDYRGFGRSGYMGCPGVDVGPARKERVDECMRRLGKYASRLSGWHAAHDLEAIRRHLGLGPVDVYGESYGTFFAQAYGRLFPAAVRTLVLDSAVPTESSDIVYMVRASGFAGVERRCAAKGACVGSPSERWKAVVANSRTPSGGPPSADDLAIIQLFGEWPEFVEPWIRALNSSGKAQTGQLRDLSAKIRSMLKGMKDSGEGQVIIPPSVVSAYGCNDYKMPFSLEASSKERTDSIASYAKERYSNNISPFEWDEINRALAGSNGLNNYGFTHEACIYWKYNQGLPILPKKFQVPVLIVSGDLDSTTTPAMASDISSEWPSSKLLAVKADHFVLKSNRCAREEVKKFITNPRQVIKRECSKDRLR